MMTSEKPATKSTELIPWNGRFTIESPRFGGSHRTFEIRTQKEDAKFAPGKRILSLLTGPSNTSDYKAFAFIWGSGVAVWKKFRSAEGEPLSQHEKLAAVIMEVVAGRKNPHGWDLSEYTVHFERKCRVCNRALTTPESIESGIGPICAGRS